MWQLVAEPESRMIFSAEKGRVEWNDAAQQLLGYPQYVDFLFNEGDQQVGFRTGRQYLVGVADDELRYRVYMQDALDEVGIEEDFEAVPQLVDHSEGEVSGMVGAVWVALPG